jgi:LmbE family N-acetylglucosaminyl deacetylase
MSHRFRHVLPVLAAVALLAATVALPAQLRLRPVAGQTGDPAIELALRKLGTAGTLMMTTAHPDDENNALLALMSHGLGLRTVLVTATRGDGGQNEIGPEIFDALAVLRTEELLAAHRFDGAEQYFTRAVDFGYSFSIDETYEKWGKDAIVGDFVRQIRTFRPDVIAGFLWDGTNGGLHHQASTHLAEEAFHAAADPARYPEQIAEGLRPWQAAKFYYQGGGGRGRGAAVSTVAVNSGVFDATLGRTYDEIGVEARTMHRCQDTSQLLPLPGGRGGGGRGYHLQDCTIPGQQEKTETSLLDGLDLSLTGLAARFGGPTPPAALQSSLRAIAQAISTATASFAPGRSAAVVGPLGVGLHELRALRAALPTLGLPDEGRYEIDFRLAQKEAQFQDAILAAATVRLDAIADDMTVTPGQAVIVQLLVANRGTAGVEITAASAGGTAVGANGRPAAPCDLGALPAGGAVQCREAVAIPADAKWTDSGFRHDPTFDRYVADPGVPFGAPFPPTPYRARFALKIAGEPIAVSLPIEARNGEDMSAGEKRSELLVVPALTVGVSPDVVVVPTGTAASREIRVTVRNNSRTAMSGAVALDVPAGWTASPASQPVSFGRTDEEATVRFVVGTPRGLTTGSAVIGAAVTSNGQRFSTGYQAVEYPHIRRRLLFRDAKATVRVIDVKVAGRQRVGYVMGVGDTVPAAIQQLGVPVTLLTADDLAWGDLSQYTVIMTGVRAYGKRPDLDANNQRLMDYVRNGGTMLVNYNRTEFNDEQYGPFPAQTTSNRVTDERAPIRVLVPDHPVFTTPNRIGPSTWDGWVQERGTYFLAPGSPEYVDLIESADPFPNNPGAKRGMLVEARLGKGRWIYIGLVLWRELPAAVPGAYQLLANLISLGHPVDAAAPAQRPAATPPRTAAPAARQ